MNQYLSNKKPLVSIITPTFNRGSFLEKTIQSIINQDYENIEHIIVDGGSSDNTVEILKKYEGKYNLRWVSEKDRGQADASNKALKMAKGAIMGLCNSDDYYTEGAIKKIVKAFIENPGIDLVFGGCQEFDYKTNRFTGIFQSDQPTVSNITTEDILSGKKILIQPSLFYRRKIIEKTGLMNINRKLLIEVDWWARMFKSNAKVLYLKNTVLSIIGQHGERGSIKYTAQGIKEDINLMKSYGIRVPTSKKLSYFRWKYPRIPNFLKNHTPYLWSAIKKIIKKI